MTTVEVQVENPSGLHARPATLFTEAAAGFQSRITVANIDRGSRAVDAKSLLMLLTIGVISGHRIRISADGPDAEAAVEKLRELVTTGLGEAAEG
jgi:phosphotransferase system HPr (HPr) family protein